MAKSDSQIEGEAEAQEITELKELLRTKQILLDFQSKAPKYYVYADNFSWSELNSIKELVDGAKRHNEAVATRSKKVLNDLLFYDKTHPMKTRPAAFITKEEQIVIRSTLSLEPHLILLDEHVKRFLDLQIQSQSQNQLRYLISSKLKWEFEEILKLLNEVIAVVVKLARLEDDVRQRLG